MPVGNLIMTRKTPLLFLILTLCVLALGGCKKANRNPVQNQSGPNSPPGPVVANAAEVQMLNAAAKGDLAGVKYLLDNGGRVNAQDGEGRTALMEASYYDHADVVLLLLNRGADLSLKKRDGATASILASGHKEVQNILAGVSDLVSAAGNGDNTKVATLANKGVPVNAHNEVGSTALAEASWNGHLDTVKLLLEKGADPSIRKTDGALPADLAASQKHPDIADLLTASAKGGQGSPATPVPSTSASK